MDTIGRNFIARFIARFAITIILLGLTTVLQMRQCQEWFAKNAKVNRKNTARIAAKNSNDQP